MIKLPDWTKIDWDFFLNVVHLRSTDVSCCGRDEPVYHITSTALAVHICPLNLLPFLTSTVFGSLLAERVRTSSSQVTLASPKKWLICQLKTSPNRGRHNEGLEAKTTKITHNTNVSS